MKNELWINVWSVSLVSFPSMDQPNTCPPRPLSSIGFWISCTHNTIVFSPETKVVLYARLDDTTTKLSFAIEQTHLICLKSLRYNLLQFSCRLLGNVTFPCFQLEKYPHSILLYSTSDDVNNKDYYHTCSHVPYLVRSTGTTYKRS